MRKELTVLNKMGLHARPAALIVRCANTFESEMTIEKDSEIVDCKSILGIITLSAASGTKLILSATGCDASAAIDAIAELFNSKFDEE